MPSPSCIFSSSTLVPGRLINGSFWWMLVFATAMFGVLMAVSSRREFRCIDSAIGDGLRRPYLTRGAWTGRTAGTVTDTNISYARTPIRGWETLCHRQ